MASNRTGGRLATALLAVAAALALPSVAGQKPAGKTTARVATVAASTAPVRAPKGTVTRTPARLTVEAQALVHWVRFSGDNAGAPFAVIDKRQARLWLFDGKGRRIGSTPVLLGLAKGDTSVPGIGEREMKLIQPAERTTPAGRFVTEPGRNSHGEDIFWVDYDAAVSMHRVRATNPAERRLQRLASATPKDNRISYGCINVPARFYSSKIKPLFARGRGIVYLLPEALPIAQFFGGPGANAKADPRVSKGPLRKV